MYQSCYINLQARLSREQRVLLAARIRSFRQVKAVSVGEQRIQLWYRGILPYRAIQQLAIAAVEDAHEAARKPADLLKEYQREALFSLASFAAMDAKSVVMPPSTAKSSFSLARIAFFVSWMRMRSSVASSMFFWIASKFRICASLRFRISSARTRSSVACSIAARSIPCCRASSSL